MQPSNSISAIDQHLREWKAHEEDGAKMVVPGGQFGYYSEISTLQLC
jgi:hypothetical protein